MSAPQHLFLTNPHVQKLIKDKSRAMVGHYGFTCADRDDIEQELRIDLLRRFKHYDPSKASIITFSDRLITHRLADLIAERQAECRDWRQEVHLSDPLPGTVGDEPVTLEDILAADFSGHAAADLRMDTRRILAGLPPVCRALCLKLQESSIVEISEGTGIPVSTLYDMRRRIRAHFQKFE
jgi:RNA polymerase sigma-70 factor (ECF subfamily)